MKQDMLRNYIRAQYPGIAITTTDEKRALAEVMEAAKVRKKAVVTWSAAEGMVLIRQDAEPKKIDETEDLLQAAKQRLEKTVYVFRDPHNWPFGRDPQLTRWFRELVEWGPANGSVVVVIAPTFRPDPTFEKMFVVVDMGLPTPDDLARVVRGVAASGGKGEWERSEEVLRALGGLSIPEAENACALSLVETKGFDPTVIYREKVMAVKRTGLLEVVDPDERGFAAIGGLDNLKGWLQARVDLWSPEAVAYGLDAPKGMLLVGVPGTGKSAAARIVGTVFRVPTLRLDIGALFNSLVGESEARTRAALQLAEAMAPCVLWADEIDKGLAGSSSDSTDGGVTRRVFGTIITWMQERKRPVFVVATANQVEALPPELLRKGRFNEIFAVDLPTAEEREAIFRVHLGRKKRELPSLAEAVTATTDFTGSEIEAVVMDALVRAFADARRELTVDDLVAEAGATQPLAHTAKEKVDGIRLWAKNRARPASRPPKSIPVAAPPIRALQLDDATSTNTGGN